MVTWVKDIIQALDNLGGQAALNQIYNEVKRIRKEPMLSNWHACIRERIEAHSSDSKHFRGKDIFHQLEMGVWALRDQAHIARSSQPIIHKELIGHGFLPSESTEEILNILRTIKQYRDYQNPDSLIWKEYVKEVFHILGFSTEELNPRLVALCVMGSSHTPKAIVGYILPGEDFEDINPGLLWDSYLLFAAYFYHVEWGILTNGLRLKVVSYKDHEPKQPSYWSDLDEIIREEQLDNFCTIYNVFSSIKGNKEYLAGNQINIRQLNGDGDHNDLAERHVRRLEFWKRLLEKAKTKTRIHARVSSGKENWVSAGAGKSGLAYSYVVRLDNAQIELYIDRGEADWNKRVFETFYRHKAEIEESFGEELDWQLLSEKRACRVRYLISDSGLNNTDRWDALQDQMIEAMIRFEKAFRPFIQQIA